MAEPNDQPTCENCGMAAMSEFVQHGSYFTKCSACGEEGPATSWRALSEHLSGQFRAVRVGTNTQSNEVVAEGEISQIANTIWLAAQKGQLIQLVATSA